jgi:hypothetical protein
MKNFSNKIQRPVELLAYGLIGVLAVYGLAQLARSIAMRNIGPSLSQRPGYAINVPVGDSLIPSLPGSDYVESQAPARETTSSIYFAGCSSPEVFYVVNRPARLNYSPEPMTLAQFKARNPNAVELTVGNGGEVTDFVSVFCDKQGVGYITLEQKNFIPERAEPLYRLYSYDAKIKKFSIVARSEMMPSAARIPVIESISPNGQFAQLRAVVCYQCDAGPGPYVLMDLGSKLMQFVDTNFVPQVSFEWTGKGGEYRYKELTDIYGVCPRERMNEIDGSCRHTPEEVPFVYGEIRQSF